MSRVEVSVDIEASPERVWSFVSELRRVPDWIEGTLEMLSVEPEPAQQGTVYRERSRIMGPWSQVTTWRITEFDPPRWQRHEGRVPMSASTSVSMRLEPSETGSKFTLLFEYTPANPLASAADRLFLRKSVQSSFGRSLQKLKALVEAPGGA